MRLQRWKLIIIGVLALLIGVTASVMAQLPGDRPDGAEPVPTIAPGDPILPTATPFFPAPQLIRFDTFVLVLPPRLNVRSAPDIETGRVLTVINSGDTFPLVDGLPDESWYLIQLDDGQGWVSGEYVQLYNAEGIDFDAPLEPSDEQLQNLDEQLDRISRTVGVPNNLILRSAPSREAESLGNIAASTRLTPIGRNEAATWLQVNYNGTVGWVSVYFIQPPQGFDPFALPITA